MPVNGRTILLSDQLMQLAELPKTLIVVGGGVIGVEYTCMLAALGVRVVLVEKRPRLLEFADQEIVEALCYHLRDHRVTLRLGEEVERVEETDGSVIATLKSQKKISGDALLYAVGRTGNVEISIWRPPASKPMRAAASASTGSTGHSQRHIFAVGDVIGFPSLASVSMEQGRLAAGHAVGTPVESNPPAIRTASTRSRRSPSSGRPKSSSPTKTCRTKQGSRTTARSRAGRSAATRPGRLKLIFHRETKEMLGVHIIGEGAAELVHIGQAVLAFKGTIDYFVNTVFNYPTLAECYKTAAFNGLNKLSRF